MKKILISAVLVSATALAGCSDWLDINVNPNNANEVPIETQLPSGIMYSVVNLGGEAELVGSFWSQHYTQYTSASQYITIRDNNLNYSSSYFSRPWSRLYNNAIPTLMEVIEKAEDKGGNYVQYEVMAKTLIAFNFHFLNSAFDQITYDEAFQGEANQNPAFLSSRDSYDKVIELLEEVLAYNMTTLQQAQSASPVGKTDMVFGGKMASWMKFANTLYVKMLLRDYPANSAKIDAALTSPIGFLDDVSGDACVDVFEDAENKSNPFYESDRRKLTTKTNIRAAEGIVNYLNTNADPRVADFYEPISNNYVGGAYGTGGNNTTSRARLGATDPVYLASVAETYFMLAEIYARKSDAANAKANYDLGVEAAFARWGHDATSFTTSGGAYEFTGGSVDAQIEQIMTQKWIAAVRCQAWDSWFDIMRTGYPQRGAGQILEAHNGNLGVGEYPARFLYPKRSSDYNVNTPEVVPLGTKMWWHK